MQEPAVISHGASSVKIGIIHQKPAISFKRAPENLDRYLFKMDRFDLISRAIFDLMNNSPTFLFPICFWPLFGLQNLASRAISFTAFYAEFYESFHE